MSRSTLYAIVRSSRFGRLPTLSRPHRRKPMSESEMHAFIAETVGSYEKHVNRGFITYRKSVTEAGHFAALEWTGHGSIVTDLMGREYIDCLVGTAFSAQASITRASSKRSLIR